MIRLLSTHCNIKHIWNQKDLDTLCNDACPICMDTHKKGDSLITQCCGKRYGKNCFMEWFSTENSNKKCPMCRQDCIRITMYKN